MVIMYSITSAMPRYIHQSPFDNEFVPELDVEDGIREPENEDTTVYTIRGTVMLTRYR